VRRAVDAGAAPGQFLLTGSASPKDAGSHSGGGRIASVRMRPLSLAERLDEPTTVSLTGLLGGERPAIAGKTTVALADYVDEILRSGFPGIRHLAGRALRAQLDGYLQRIVDRDFPELGHQVRNPEALRRWMRAYAAAVSTTASFEKIRDATTSGQDTVPAKTTVGPYRGVLERLFILDPVISWQPPRSQIRELGFPSKHQLVDPALPAQLLGATKDALLKGQAPGPVIPRDGTLLGALFESLVTLSVRVYAQAAEAQVKHLRTHRGDHEIDLIVQAPDGRVVAIEVKLSAVPPNDAVTHLKWLADRIGDELLDAVIITTGTEAYRRQDGIAIVPAGLLGV
jgi:predicted AAA+ superfamily ATPase